MKPHRKKFFSARAVWLAAVLALFAFNGIGRAQTNAAGGRWLLIFEASSTMKKRLPGTEAAVRRFFSARAEGQLKDGDSIGVWAFDQQIDGRFPAFDWTADGSAESVSNLLAYLRGQRYRTDSKFGILAAPLDHVVAVSSNLTILIFCDGQSELVGTPYNLGVNKIFQSSRAERKKTRQPFVLMLRSQLGKFVGCTVNFPPGNLNLPAFPPLPLPPPAPVSRPVVVAPPPMAPPLLIVGKTVFTNETEAAEKLALAESAKTNAAPVVTSPPPAAVTSAAPVIPAKPPASVPPKTSHWPSPWLLGVLAGILAVALAATLVLRARRPQSSLITTSMENDRRP